MDMGVFEKSNQFKIGMFETKIGAVAFSKTVPKKRTGQMVGSSENMIPLCYQYIDWDCDMFIVTDT